MFHTLQGVAEEIFAGEIAYARMIEEIEPGSLRALAAGMGKAEAFDTAHAVWCRFPECRLYLCLRAPMEEKIMSMDDSEAAGRLGGYADMILGIDDTVNPVGVECWMRLQYGTLDHLPRETFAAEAAMAKVGEELQPGSLREIAGTYDSAERYDIAQGIIDARAKARDEAAAGDPLVADFIAGGGRPAASFSSLDIGWDPGAQDFPVSVLMSAEESGAQLSVVYDDGRGPDRRQRVVTGTAREVAERLGQQGYAVELQPPGRGPASFSLPPGEDGEAMKAAAEPRADGGTPPDRGGRMSRGRPAGDIIEREAREAGEEVDRELGRAREALAAAGVPCRDVVVEMAPHRTVKMVEFATTALPLSPPSGRLSGRARSGHCKSCQKPRRSIRVVARLGQR